MKIIKYKAIDKQYKFLGIVNFINWLSDSEIEINYDVNIGEPRAVRDDVVILKQYSTLNDKLDKEIYGKDKCKVQLSTGEIVNAIVEFVDGCFELHFNKPILIQGLYKNRDYLKCWTCNHAVTIVEEDEDE